MWKLYLDDLRTPIDKSLVVARSTSEAIALIERNGMPIFISFDHDLGVDKNGDLLPNGYDFAYWLTKNDLDGKIIIPNNITYKVHSQNPVGKMNIESLMTKYLQYKKQTSKS